MPIETGYERLNVAAIDMLETIVAPRGGESVLGRNRSIRESATHDFSRYQFLLDPTRIHFTGAEGDAGLGGIGEVPYSTWIGFDRFARHFSITLQAHVEIWMQRDDTVWIVDERHSDYTLVALPYEGWINEARVQAATLQADEAFRVGMAPSLYAGYTVSDDPEKFLSFASPAVNLWIEEKLNAMRDSAGRVRETDFFAIQEPAFWEAGAAVVLGRIDAAVAADIAGDAESDGIVDEAPDLGENLPENFSFDPFRPGTVNFGLQIIYRQSWTPLGTQPGEIVRTLPLGPKQSEKVSIKTVRRSKSARTSELQTSVETSTESTATTRDSEEVMKEASESFNWHVEASASASFGFGSASLEAGFGGENASASRDTKAQLNETMEKTASRIKNDTKIVITTEQEDTTELNQASEIVNNNEEIAVTYIYSRLQRQYELTTYLSEVNTTIFVAEEIPAPREITGPWIRRYDWILARALLDDSFRKDLETVRANAGLEDERLEGPDSNITALMETLSGDGTAPAPGIPDYTSLSGTIPDMFQNPQNAYEREVERARARRSTRREYARSVARLRGHIYDNILHYCRAIWSAEDPSARLMRYAKIRVPVNWEFVSSGAPDGHTLSGHYAPAIREYERDTARLSELIDPVGPVGYAGNYTVFYLRGSDRWESLQRALDFQRLPFLRMAVNVRPDSGQWREGVSAEGVASDNRLDGGRYRLEYLAEPAPAFRVLEERAGAVYTEVDTLPLIDGEPLQFHSIRVWFEGVANLRGGDTFLVEIVSVPALEDPELKRIRWDQRGPRGLAEEREYFTPETLAAMANQFTDIRDRLEGADADAGSWEELSEETRTLIRRRLHAFILRDRHTRRIVVDTNNLILTREVDGASTLEPFKGLHRLADVLDAYEKLDERRLANLRRKTRIDVGALGDPDVEKVTVVATSRVAAGLAALDGLEDDPPPPPTP